ncbi:MAG: ATP-binding cassette domain-containing protein [Dethiobacter sp.]|nr:MAG: ATP-binding cassette domain-containing protein [Dethiobacter sp.]
MFVLKNVCYKDVLEIEELVICPQKITCIIGESGSGKTTFLKMLDHLISPDQGTIEYKGQDIKALDPVLLRREVILLPQTPVIFPGTIKHNLLIGLFFARKTVVDDSTLLEIVNKIGLKRGLLDDASTLSGGEKQRLALGRVMLIEPEVMLLDEPTSALDDDTEAKTIEYVKNYVKRRRKTLVMVTHSKQLAKNYGETIVTISNGKLVSIEEVA